MGPLSGKVEAAPDPTQPRATPEPVPVTVAPTPAGAAPAAAGATPGATAAPVPAPAAQEAREPGALEARTAARGRGRASL